MNKVLKDDMTEAERAAAVARKGQRLIAKATEGTEYDADVESFYHGNEFYLFVYHKFNDVRLVGAPPAASANTVATRTTGCGRVTPATSPCSVCTRARMDNLRVQCGKCPSPAQASLAH